MKTDKVLTVRVAGRRLRKLMRARGIKRQSDLITRLLEEEEERLESLAVLRRTPGTARRSDFDDRLLLHERPRRCAVTPSPTRRRHPGGGGWSRAGVTRRGHRAPAGARRVGPPSPGGAPAPAWAPR